MNYNIELYKENGYFCAYIGEDNGSGYEIHESNESDCARKIAQYFEDYVDWEEVLEEED